MLKKLDAVGFAQIYLHQFNKGSNPEEEIDIEVYTKLVQLDSKLGTTASEQLYRSIYYTTRSDIIQVLIIAQNSRFKIILVYRFCASE